MFSFPHYIEAPTVGKCTKGECPAEPTTRNAVDGGKERSERETKCRPMDSINNPFINISLITLPNVNQVKCVLIN